MKPMHLSKTLQRDALRSVEPGDDEQLVVEEATCCGDCRFAPDASKGACGHPRAPETEGRVRVDFVPPPEWCPLRLHPVLTRFKPSGWNE